MADTNSTETKTDTAATTTPAAKVETAAAKTAAAKAELVAAAVGLVGQHRQVVIDRVDPVGPQQLELGQVNKVVLGVRAAVLAEVDSVAVGDTVMVTWVPKDERQARRPGSDHHCAPIAHRIDLLSRCRMT